MTKLPAQLLILVVRGYQLCISPLLPQMCRFSPTCSQFAVEALKLHGAFKGTFLATWRICRCHPFHPGGYDPVPTPNPKASTAERTDLHKEN